MAGQESRSSNFIWLLMLVIVAALAFVGWNEWRTRHPAATAAPVAVPAPAAPTPARPDSADVQHPSAQGQVLNM